MDKHCFNGLEANSHFPKNSYPYQTNSENNEAYFQLALEFFKNHDYVAAERWLRYAAIQRHYQASRHLIAAVCDGNFKDPTERINFLAIEILEKFVTPSPTQSQIDKLEALLTAHLNIEYGLVKSIHPKE